MKRFELFEYDKETERLEEIDEIRGLISKVSGLIKSAVGRLKSLFSFKNYKFGQRKKMKLSISIPSELVEADRSDNTGNTRKLTGPQIELYCCDSIGKEFETLGFGEIIYKVDGGVVTQGRPAIRTMAKKLQKDIEAKIKKRDSGKPANQKEDPRLAHKTRMEYGVVTGERLRQVLTESVADSKENPGMYSVTIDAVGENRTGIEKTDIEITVGKMGEDDFVKRLKISHKAAQTTAFGTQGNYKTIPFYILTGIASKIAKRSSIMGDDVVRTKQQYEMIVKFGEQYNRNWRNILEEFGQFTTSVKKRSDDPKKFERVADKYYGIIAAACKDNPDNVLKMVGMEKDVEHFYVNAAKDGKYKSYYSGDSEWFKDFYNQVFKEKLKMAVTYNKDGVYIKFSWGRGKLWETSLSAMTTGKKDAERGGEGKGGSNVNIRGLGTDDLGDSERIQKPKGVRLPPIALDDDEFKRSVEAAKVTTVKNDVDSAMKSLATRRRYYENNLRLATVQFNKIENATKRNPVDANTETMKIAQSKMEELTRLGQELDRAEDQLNKMVVSLDTTGITTLPLKGSFDAGPRTIKTDMKALAGKLVTPRASRSVVTRQRITKSGEPSAQDDPRWAAFEKDKRGRIEDLDTKTLRQFNADKKRLPFDKFLDTHAVSITGVGPYKS